MPDLELQIRDYIKATSRPVTADEVLHAPVPDNTVQDSIEAVTVFDLSGPNESPETKPRRTRAAVLAVAAVVLLVAGVAVVAGGPRGDVATGPVVADQTSSPAATAAGPRVVVSPLVQIHDLLAAEWADTELFSVAVPEGEVSHWRLAGLAEFDGRVWRANNRYVRADGEVPSAFDASVPTRSVVQTVSVAALDTVFVPAAYEVREVVDDGGVALSHSSESGTLIVGQEVPGVSGLTYTVVSSVPVVDTARLEGASTTSLGADFLNKYTALPSALSAAIRTEAQRITTGTASDYERVLALQAHFQDGFSYDAGTPLEHDLDDLEEFLFRAQEGSSEQFAAAFAVLARSVDLPTRVGVGFTRGEWDASRGEYVVRGEHAHAWPEVFFEGTGWVQFEPTPDPASSPTPPDPTPRPGEAGPPPSVVDSLGYRWSRVPFDEAVFGGADGHSMASVTAGGPGLVAVGGRNLVSGPGEDFDAAVWTSVDGITWSRVPHDEEVFGVIPGDQEMMSVTVGGPGLVAVGPDSSRAYGERAAVWTSVDGITWSRVPHDEAVFGGEGMYMTTVTGGGPGLVAFGDSGAVWTSVDGLTWSRVPHELADLGDGESSGVTVGGPGLVAVGGAGGDAAVWTSVDGLSWSRVPHDDAVFGGADEASMGDVTVGGPGLVAVGSDGFWPDGAVRGQLANWGRDFSGGAAVWTSVDGITWSRVPHDEAIFGGEGNQWMSTVTAVGRGLVAVGGDWSSEGHAAAVWTSVDGITWSRVPHDEAVFGGEGDQEINSVTAAGPVLVAVGESNGPRNGDAAIWVATPGN